MLLRPLFFLLIVLTVIRLCNATSLFSQTQPEYIVSTYSGSLPGYEDGSLDKAKFNYPFGLCLDSIGNIYLADSYNHCIRKITPSGLVSTIAGNGQAGFVNGQALNARFNTPSYLAIGADGVLYVSDDYNHCIRKITPDGTVSTWVGNGSSGFRDGIGKDAQFHTPRGLAFDKNGFLYVADWANQAIRKISPEGNVITIKGYQGGYCNGLVMTSIGTLYISSFFTHKIWQMDTQEKFSVFAGSGVQGRTNGKGEQAQFNNPYSLTIDNQGTIYVGEEGSFLIRKITPAGDVQTIAGSLFGYVDGIATMARFSAPKGVVADKNGNIFVADYNNHRIRKITPILRPQEPTLKIVAQTCSTYTIQVQAATQQVIEGIQLIAANSNNVELELLSSLPATTVFIVVRLKDRTSRGNFRLMATATGNLSAALSGTFELQPSLSIASPLHNQTFRVPSTPSMMCTTLTVRNPSAMAMNINTAYTLNNTSFSLVPSQFPVFVPPLSTANLKICFAPPKPGEYQDTVVIPTGDCGALHIPLVATGLINLFAIDSSRCLIAGNSLNTANISLYPNPVIDQCTILLQHRNPEYHQNLQVPYIVSNILGQTVLQGELALFTVNNEPMLYQAHIEVQTIPPGYYYVTISGVQTFGRIPFVIQR